MSNVLEQIELDDDFIFIEQRRFDEKEIEQYLEIYKKYRAENTIQSDFSDQIWIVYTDVLKNQISFSFNYVAYNQHAKKYLDVSVGQLTKMLKCYALYICGEFIFRTIAIRIKTITTFLTCLGDEEYKATVQEKRVIADFLFFVNMSEKQIDDILRLIPEYKTKVARQRKLGDLVSYLIIDSEITDLYTAVISEEEFLRWFPIFFWCKITFILPLRATEMMLTPFSCLRRRGDDVYLSVRRTKLKGKKEYVSYNVDKDYQIFEYKIPNNSTVSIIEKYQELTKEHERRFLFDYGTMATNEMFSLESMSKLLSAFVEEKLSNTTKYDYAKYTSGIQKFNSVKVGDSRPIAMSNLYFQDVGADICRQLANHMNINTSAGYYTNVSNTVMASSIMQLQRKINYEYNCINSYENIYEKNINQITTNRQCVSVHQPLVTGDISDCIAEGHLEDCLGCRYYTPTTEQLKQALETRRKKLEASNREIIKCMASGTDKSGIDFDKLFLDAHTSIVRYKIACDEKAKGELKKWQRHKNTTMTC